MKVIASFIVNLVFLAASSVSVLLVFLKVGINLIDNIAILLIANFMAILVFRFVSLLLHQIYDNDWNPGMNRPDEYYE
jgi:O-antigen ligase